MIFLQPLKNAVRHSNPLRSIGAFYFEITHPKKNDEWAVLCPGGLGDTYILCGLAEAIKQIHGGNAFTVYVKPTHTHIPKIFPAIDNVRIFKGKQASYFKYYGFGIKNTFPGFFNTKEALALIGYKGITVMDYYKAMFRLPMETIFSIPQKPSDEEMISAEHFMKANKMPMDRTVLILPEANSNPSMDPELLIKMRNTLEKRGLSVFVRAINNERRYGQSFSYFNNMPIHLIHAIAEMSGWVITMRSGMADILSHNNCRLTVLYPDIKSCSGKFIETSSLQAMGLSKTAEEFELNKNFDFGSMVLNKKD